MNRTHFSPPELFDGRGVGFSQVVVTDPGRMVFVSGQVAWDREREIADPSLEGQTDRALENLRLALAAAGAGPDDVVMVRIYFVDYRPENAETLGARLRAFFGERTPPAATWVGVASLASPDFRVEIEAVAVVGQ